MASGLNTIVLKGKGHHDEGITDATIYPGEAVRMASDSHFDPEPLTPDAAVGRGIMLAKEDALQGKTVDDAYAATDTLFFYIPLPGDHVQVLAKTGEDINVADYLDVEGSGSGKFIKVSASATAAYPISLTFARKHDDLTALLPASVPTADTVGTYKVPLTSARKHDDMSAVLPATVPTAVTTGTFLIPITTAKRFDAMATDVPAAAANDDMGLITGTPGTDPPRLQGVDFGGTTADEKCAFEYILPQTYVAGQAVTLRVRAGMLTTVSDGTATLDAEVWRDDGDGTMGAADICDTAAQSINSLTMANIDFTITPTTLNPGDKIIINLSFAASDTGNLGVMIPEIQEISLLCVTAALASDDMALVTGTPGTDAPRLQGVDFGGTTSDEKCAFEIVLPDNYVSGETVTLRCRAAMITMVSDGTATLDVECWEAGVDGAVGGDICATAAQSINSLTPANIDFTITPTAVAAGDKLIVRLSFAGSDTGNAGVMIPEVSDVSLLLDTAALAGDDMALVTGTPGANAPTLRGVDFGGTTSDEKCGFEYTLPDNYRAGSTITVRVKAGLLTTVSDGTATIDVECWKDDGDGTVGASDICATAAQSINSLTMANKSFTITPTGLVAGDKLILRLSFAASDTGNLGVMIPEIQALHVLTGNAAQGRLEALEDSGGALAAATLIKCRVMSL